MSEQSSLRVFISKAAYPVLSGTFAFLAGFCGKHAFSDDIGGLTNLHTTFQSQYVYYAVRALFLALMLYMNGLMMKFLIQSFQQNGATLTTVMNFSFNFIMSGLSSFFYFKEPMDYKWFIGISMVILGIFFLATGKETDPKHDKGA